MFSWLFTGADSTPAKKVNMFSTVFFLFCLSFTNSLPQENSTQASRERTPRHLLSHFLGKIHQGLHAAGGDDEDVEEDVKEASSGVEQEAGSRFLEECRTRLEEVEEVIDTYFLVTIQRCTSG